MKKARKQLPGVARTFEVWDILTTIGGREDFDNNSLGVPRLFLSRKEANRYATRKKSLDGPWRIARATCRVETKPAAVKIIGKESER